MSVPVVIPHDVFVRIMEAFAERNATLSRSYIPGDWNQFNKANASIAAELWPLLNGVGTEACARAV